MYGARDTVVVLDVSLGDGILFIHRGLREITQGRGFNHVADGKTLDCLVLGDTTMAVETTHVHHMSSVFLATAVVASLDGLIKFRLVSPEFITSKPV
jgi:hypothetical protein